jgi:hypothetical protein
LLPTWIQWLPAARDYDFPDEMVIPLIVKAFTDDKVLGFLEKIFDKKRFVGE